MAISLEGFSIPEAAAPRTVRENRISLRSPFWDNASLYLGSPSTKTQQLPPACVSFSPVDPQQPSRKRIAVIPGDGIGQEVIPQALKVMRASGADVELSEFDWSADRYLRDVTTVPPDGFAMLERDFDAIFAGAFGDPRVPTNIHAKEILLGMRFKMDLYANVRPVRLLDASLCPLKGIEPKDLDFVVIRENTEGIYLDRGSVSQQGTEDEVAIQEDVNTRKGVDRIIRYAFDDCLLNKKTDGRV